MNGHENNLLKDAAQRIEELHEQALALIHDYWDFRNKGDKETKDFDLKSKIFPRVKETANGFVIEWYRAIKWFKTENGQRKPKYKFV